ncbi:uncharacterized protein LOC114527012 [Dendronephthya gigantea]|uniref:uncharacterized protein LOC114527012 n=1 Tax=Dendronephthya gigantea TaxID=151771 RepID=UPI00106A6C82|nr:uncharacterized protein LOC114527012 [Dendronephthya gigantea]
MLRLFVLTLSVLGAVAYTVDYELEDLDRMWARGVPGVDNGGGGSSSDCKRDMWILWDNSWSVGVATFQSKVRPFLKELIASPQLNVGPGGTHIGIITFSTQKQTKVLLEMGEKQTKEELESFLDSLQYNQISGDGTRTGMALKMADEKFPLSSPDNYRADVGDVVMIFTDGEPIRRRGEDTFGAKYSHRKYGEGLLASDRAKSLRDKDVTVVGLAVGTEYTLRKFRDDIRGWSTEGKYFEANKETLQGIMSKLISASCIDPGQCLCDTISSEDNYVAAGQTALIRWVEPSLKCESGRSASVQSRTVNPPVRSPSRFGVGQHQITYTYAYMRGTKETKQNCFVNINVKECQCQPGVVRVDEELPAGRDTASVSWTIPRPNCPASLSSVSPPEARNGRGNYEIGKHEVTYNYVYSGASGSFSLACKVEITIKGKRCGGVGMGPNQVCCCGTLHERKPNHDCCGPKYYDTRYQNCVDFYTLESNNINN